MPYRLTNKIIFWLVILSMAVAFSSITGKVSSATWEQQDRYGLEWWVEIGTRVDREIMERQAKTIDAHFSAITYGYDWTGFWIIGTPDTDWETIMDWVESLEAD